MHILTKIFIVLVSLLAVLMVPLVVVYSHNENNYKSRLVDAEMKAAANADALQAAEASAVAKESKLNNDVSDLRALNSKYMADKDSALATVRQLESQLASSESGQAEIKAQLTSIAAAIDAGQKLNETLIADLRSLRTQVAASEKEKVQLDEALREMTSQFELAENARRALAEELARLKDEHAGVVTKLGQAVAEGFNLRGGVAAGALRNGLVPDKSLTARVVGVQRSNTQVLAEIDAGSRDGVKAGWAMSISRGGDFVANLRIVSVDINRSTGEVTLEDRSGRKVEVGDSAHAKAGLN